MELMPILSTLRRHKTAAGLIVLEVALSCAIVCNALHLIVQRQTHIHTPSGLAESELVTVDVAGIGPVGNLDEITSQDLKRLSELPGVQGVTIINQVHFGNQSSISTVRTSADDRAPGVGASPFQTDVQGLRTLGLKLIEGRDFQPEEQVLDNDFTAAGENAQVPAVILNRTLARKLFPGESAVGKTIYTYGSRPSQVVGVVETLSPPQPIAGSGGIDGPGNPDGYALLAPMRNSFRGGSFVLRVQPGQQEAVMKAAEAALRPVSDKRIVRPAKRLVDMRQNYFAQDRAMIWLLGGVCVALLLVTAFGIVGLASFWVQQRTRMIGTRRALGATRGQILRYFQLENFLLSTAGIALGMGAAYGINLALIRSYEMPLLPAFYLPVGALTLWALGQLAVLGPARRAAALPPVAALRF